MNKSFIYAMAFVTSLFCTSERANANNAGGGELIYEWLTDSTYRFYFKLSRYCAGNPEPANVTMCVKNTCNSTSFTRTLVQVSKSVAPLPAPYCAGYKTNCDSAASTIPGFKTVWYTDTCTLPFRCNYWSFSVTVPGRPATHTIQNPGATDMCIEATLNNTGTNQSNSSPYFAVPAFPFVCHHQLHSFNNGATDPDNDSLITEIIYPQNANGACPAGPVNATLGTAIPPLSIPGNPVNSTTMFTLNGLTGQFSFTSPQMGIHTMAIRVNEYKNGVKKGSIMREVSFSTLSCPQPVPVAITNALCGSLGFVIYHISPPNMSIEACGASFSFCFAVIAPGNPNAKLLISDNHLTEMPGSSLTYVNQNTDSVKGTFYWTPTASQAGAKVLSVKVMEADCQIPGINPSSTLTIPVDVLPVTYPLISITANPGASISSGQKVSFTATASCNGMFQWRKNGIDIPGATNDFWSSAALKDLDAIGCNVSCIDDCVSPKNATSNTIIMRVATGIKEAKAAEQLHIYPNPNNGQFTVGGAALLNMDKLDIEVWNSIGQIVFKHTISKQSEASDVEITIPEIVPGIYQLSIRTPAGTRSTPFTVID